MPALMPPIRAVLFDFGGTLCTFGAVEVAARETARMLAGWFGLEGQEERVFAALQAGVGRAFREYAGRPFFLHRELLAAGYRYGLSALGVDFNEVQVREALDRFWRQQNGQLAMRDGVPETLSALR